MSFISALEQLFIGAYVNVAANVLYLFESCITLSQEVEVIWGSRKRSTTIGLYAFTRYTPFLLSVCELVPPWDYKSCAGISVLSGALSLVQFICIALFSALRVHALLGGKLPITWLVLGLNLMPLFTNLFSYISSTLAWDEEVHICNQFTTESSRISLLLSLSTRIAVIIADVIVLLVTWYKTLQTYMESRRLRISTPLVALLLRDGTAYFAILTIINILLPIANDIPSLVNMDLAASFLTTLVPIVVCRFILNLRQLDVSRRAATAGILSVSIDFASNLGDSLPNDVNGGHDEHDEHDEHDAENTTRVA